MFISGNLRMDAMIPGNDALLDVTKPDVTVTN